MHTTRDLLLGPLRAVNAAVGERPWKNLLRAQLLDWRNALPRELMVRPGDIAVQVGMWRQRNVERLSKCVGSEGRVVLVEADQRNVENLLVFLRAEGIQNVTVIPKAAWNRRGKFDLCVAHDPAHNRLNVDHIQMLGEVNQNVFVEAKTIEVDTVDNILAELGLDRVDFVEVSVNGAELQVLQGMQQTLPRTSRVFAAGYARDKENGQPLNQRTESFLRAHGFHTKISTTTPPTQAKFDKEAALRWGNQEGHVFAWRD